MGKHTIKLKKYSDVIEELVAVAAITPGMLLELTSAGKVQAHSNAGLNALPYFALEDEMQGNGVNTAYAADDKVQVWIPYRGDIVNAILADGQNIAIGDYLESNGDGMLKKHVADVESFESAEAGSITVYPLQIVGQAIEAVNISDSSGGESSGDLGYDKRIQIRII